MMKHKTILLLAAVLFIFACGSSKQTAPLLIPSETEILQPETPASAEVETEIEVKTQIPAHHPAVTPEPKAETKPAPGLMPSLSKPKAADKQEPPLEEKPTGPVAKERKSYIVDGRYLHPFLEAPYIENGQELYPAPWSYEDMKFYVYFSLMKVGTAWIRTKGVIDTPYGPAYVIETVAESASVIDAVFKVRDFNYSLISVKDFSAIGYSQSIREGKYVRDEWVTFDPEKGVFSGIVRKKDGVVKPINGELPGPTQEFLSALYYVRQLDLSKNDPITFDVTNREKTYPLQVDILKREKVKTDAGKFQAVAVEPKFRGDGIFVQKGKSIKVWISEDQDKKPLKLETKVFIGSVSAELAEYKKTKR